MIQTEAPAAHRSPVTKPSKPTSPRPSKPSKPKAPEAHKKREAPSRGGGTKKGKKESPKKSAGVDERDTPEFEGEPLQYIPSLGKLPN